MSKMLAAIFGCSGPKLTPAEAMFFRDANPWAFILFARNIKNPKQVSALCNDLRKAVGRDALIFVDQEGGRVQRLRSPYWDIYRPAADFAALYKHDKEVAQRATYLNMRLIADDLRQVGITANCAPVLDIPVKGADDIISDRAYGTSADDVIKLAHAAMAGLLSGGVAPVIKHIPGHGRATVDSHKALPVIDTAIRKLGKTDFAPFKALSDAPMAMTAHAVFTKVDKTAPITISKTAFDKVIRKTIGFDGLVMSDDLDMKALSGTLTNRTEDALKAGCDIALQCSGQLPDMVNVAKGAKSLEGKALLRANIAELSVDLPLAIDREAVKIELEELMNSSEILAS